MATAQRFPKYKNKLTNGYHSAKEATRAAELHALQAAGVIEDLVEQPEYTLIPRKNGERAVTYRADFQYFDKERKTTVIEDVKSDFTRKLPVYRIKRRMMQHLLGLTITEVM